MGHITKPAAASNYREKDMGSALVKNTIEAMVEVTLNIEGKDAHKSEIYGADDFQRIFDDNGQTNVNLQDHKKKVIKRAWSIHRPEIRNVPLRTELPKHTVRLSQLTSRRGLAG